GNDKEISGEEKKHEEGMKKLSEPFRELSETVIPDIESQTLEHKIKKLQESIQHIDSSRELTIKEFYKVLKERNVARKKIVCLENHERYIEPIEEEIQELSLCAKTPGEASYKESSKNDLRDRYSTFLYTPDEHDNREPKMGLGENYTSYQLDKNVYRRKRMDNGFLKHTELVGIYHEDYERVLVFASSLIGESIYRLQESIRKVELDLYESIERENL
ncbi:11900_t:CDS:2, partial [Acaulospora morrowiae]